MLYSRECVNMSPKVWFPPGLTNRGFNTQISEEEIGYRVIVFSDRIHFGKTVKQYIIKT
jgi:hypothetical protein